MLDLFRHNPRRAKRLAARIREAMREIGVLLIAFSPLDVAVNRGLLRSAVGTLLLFLGLGSFLFLIALAAEWRWEDDD